MPVNIKTAGIAAKPNISRVVAEQQATERGDRCAQPDMAADDG